MIGIDTNVLIRYITQDDKTQSKKANNLIEQELSESVFGFVTLVSLIEIVWVLESCYEQKKSDLINVVGALLTTKQIKIERSDIAYLALKDFESGNGDFSDAVIARLSKAAGCTKVVTFDKKAVSVGMEIL